jgi:galactonate dehydratase
LRRGWAWDDELFTYVPVIVDGHLIMPDRKGWGTEPTRNVFAPIGRKPKAY